MIAEKSFWPLYRNSATGHRLSVLDKGLRCCAGGGISATSSATTAIPRPSWLLDLARQSDPSPPTQLEPEKAPDPFKEPLPHPDHWREIVGRWDLDRRQEWADWAEEFQRLGYDWKRAEFVAWCYVMWPETYIR